MKEKIKQILSENVDELSNATIDDNLQLIAGGYIDSFDIINLISEFEDIFDVAIPIDEIDLSQFDTVNSIEELIVNLKK
ncbi:MAG: acyl carrier protein [Ruminococcus sp.]|nr:acyl carrier protein [Ruminococcus sp.]